MKPQQGPDLPRLYLITAALILLSMALALLLRVYPPMAIMAFFNRLRGVGFFLLGDKFSSVVGR